MILGYILTFSLLIMSVIKFVGAMKYSDDQITKKRTEFIQETKKSHQDGSITLMAVLLTFMISSLLMFFAYKFKIELQEARYRKDSYLCFKYLNVETQNYVTDMAKFNWALRIAYAAIFSGVATAKAKIAHQGIVIARNARHFYYIKNLISNQYCKNAVSNFSYLKNLPFETTQAYVLNTNIDATSKLREKEWTITYYKTPNGVRFKNTFCLTATMSAEGAFNPDFKIQTAEISMKGFSQLKCLSGSQ